MFLRRERNPRVFIQFYFNFKDKGVVLKAARIALKKTTTKIYSHYPEIIRWRKDLVPIVKEFRDNEHRAYIDVSKLYVDVEDTTNI